ncbi:MAG: accessory Sec system translocase SecA2 [Candidatus Latescibacteria bacterium]|nr:accessory Sec system translocase SecA2 [Candidatus Latescibacterota bacterium]
MTQPSPLNRLLERWRGSPVEYELSQYQNELGAIEARAARLAAASDHRLQRLAAALGQRVRTGTPAAAVRPTAFALVREAAQRVLGLRPFGVQLLAGLALHQGKIAQLNTGEGKTLAAVAPAFLNALTGGVHILTFNDYLARRDAEWMGPLYRFLGLEVDFVQEDMDPQRRRQAYAADITYLTAKEAGFDFLRGGLARHPDDRVQRPFHAALVDEADSTLIDEARVPLVIAGQLEIERADPGRMAQLVGRLDPEIHFAVDEYSRNIQLTDSGVDWVEAQLECGPLHEPANLALLTGVNLALHAGFLLQRDIDYIVRHDRIEVVDEFTGRVVENRHWPHGLQAAVEAKEELPIQAQGSVLGSITLQHFMGLYPKLAGMTGTAVPAAEELAHFYGLKAVVIPPNKPCIRRDHPDRIFSHQAAKTQALVDEIEAVHVQGRPLLVGTASVDESERLAAALQEKDIACQVLNARTDDREAAIIAGAGALGAVTISTNMAGRGTDIRLGGANGEDEDQVRALGGLYVMGTNRHESRRIDDQLRGRAGRQGDPGAARFFVSLDDPLFQRYRLRELIPAFLWPAPQEKTLDHPVINAETARAQRIVEGQNFDIRRTLYQYTTLIEQQRQLVAQRRDELLQGTAAGDLLAAELGDNWKQLNAALATDDLQGAARQVALTLLDRAWADQLALAEQLREGIHLQAVGGRRPVEVFQEQLAQAFAELLGRVDQELVAVFAQLDPEQGLQGLDPEMLQGPSSTWTYLVDDNPFADGLGLLSADPGRAAATAIGAGPLLLVWAVWRWLGRNRR